MRDYILCVAVHVGVVRPSRLWQKARNKAVGVRYFSFADNMQTGSHSGAISTNSQSANIAGLNGRISFAGSNGPGPQHVPPDNFIFENVDPTHLDGDDDSDGDMSPTIQYRGAGQGPGQTVSPTGVKPGKKTKGRVKIKMEFIENKLRRYTTFSKRKTGIMKKVCESSADE